jgi:hypothetical protein
VSTGPYLYDDDPAPLHTGTPRPARALILAVIGGTLAALAQDDLETAYGLLCTEERARLAPQALPAEYAPGGTGEITGTTADEVDGAPVQRVEVAWSDGSTSTLTVVSEQGARVCGTATG